MALVKIDMMEELSSIAHAPTTTMKWEPGSEVAVMGYPGMSPDQFVANLSQDAFNKNPAIVKSTGTHYQYRYYWPVDKGRGY